jgi:hypothetical protein
MDGLAIRARAHHAHLARGDVDRAVRCASWIAFWLLLINGDRAHATGWIARARRLVDDGQPESISQGYLLLPEAMAYSMEGDGASAWNALCRAVDIGTRCGDTELIAFARNGQGRTLVRTGRPSEGMVLLDDIMVSVAAGTLSAMTSATMYCSVLKACHETFDVRRAREWTAALAMWRVAARRCSLSRRMPAAARGEFAAVRIVVRRDR